MATSVRLPPGIGKLLDEPLLYNEFQQRFIRARRMRFCLHCKRMGAMNEMGQFTCANCKTTHDGRWGNLTAPRAFNRFLLLAGRGGGKTLVGAHAVREELMIPGAVWWAMGASYKLLHDSTFPTLVGLLHPSWVQRWDPEHMEITLKNGAMVAFRSLEDPDRARGPHGVGGMWFDEAAQCPERAWHVGVPMLIKAGGIAIASTTVLGFDWTYEQLERQALIYKEPGYWAAKWKTTDNPLFRTNPVMRAEIDRARKTMVPELYAQEYEAERSNAQGLIYGQLIEKAYLKDDEQVRKFIPEWPQISPSRKVIVGLDSGVDHPFGAVLMVVTERGIIVIGDYLERMKATSAAHDDIFIKFGMHRFPQKQWAGNKNEANLILEFGLKGTGVIKAENNQEVGIQRVQSWLMTGQFRIAYTAKRTYEQMKAYRRADNLKPSTGEKTEKEKVFKLHDELCDGVRYGLMAWPELPDLEVKPMTDAESARWNALDEKSKRELELARERKRDGDGTILTPEQAGYPLGDIFQHDGPADGAFDDISIMY